MPLMLCFQHPPGYIDSTTCQLAELMQQFSVSADYYQAVTRTNNPLHRLHRCAPRDVLYDADNRYLHMLLRMCEVFRL